MARGNLYAFVFPTTGARHYVSARNEATRIMCEGLARFLLENGYATRERDVDGSRHVVRVLEMPFI